MIKLNNLQPALLAASLLALPVAYASTMTKADYKPGKTRISADYKAERAACASMKANAKDICTQEAKEKVALAEVEYGHTCKAADGTKVLVARAESACAVAKERCDDQSGNAKVSCVAAAKATFGKT